MKHRSTIWVVGLVTALITCSWAAFLTDQITVTGPGGGNPSIIARAPINAVVGPIVTSTAAAVTVTSQTANGTIFLTKEDGANSATTYTLPTPTAALAGKHFYFVQYNDQDMIITTAGGSNGDCIVTLHANAADTATWGTSSQKIGATGWAWCDGTNWYVTSLCGTVAGAG